MFWNVSVSGFSTVSVVLEYYLKVYTFKKKIIKRVCLFNCVFPLFLFSLKSHSPFFPQVEDAQVAELHPGP